MESLRAPEAPPPILTSEAIAEATARTVVRIGYPVVARLVRRQNGREVHVASGPLGSVVVKRGPRERIRREARLLRLLGRRMVGAVPEVHGDLPGIDGFAMQVLDQHRWATWEAVLAAGAGHRQARPVGRLMARLHRLGRRDDALQAAAAAGHGVVRDHAQQIFGAAYRDDPQVRAVVSSLVRDVFSRRTSVVHGDFVVTNVMVGASPPVLIDFEKAAVGDPAYDMGKLVGMAIGEQIYRPRAFLGTPMRFALAATVAAWRDGVDWEPPARATARATRIALAIALAVARAAERGPDRRLPSLPAQIDAARRLLLAGADRIEPIVDALVPPDGD